MKFTFKIIFALVLLFVVSCEPVEIDVTLTTVVSPAKSGTVFPDYVDGPVGSVVTLEATPSENYYFKGWYSRNKLTLISDMNPAFLYMGNHVLITAIFELKDTDTDGDRVMDEVDACADTPEGESVDENGCSDSQSDTDGDGVMDDVDACAETPEGESVDESGCSDSQSDTDGDGVMDDVDACAETPEGESVDENGCSVSQLGIEGINFMRGELSGGSADIIEMSAGSGASIYRGLSSSEGCSSNWYPRGSLCDEAPYVNDPNYSYRDNVNTGATWNEGRSNGYGILVIDLGSEQVINSMSVFQMFSGGRLTHIEAYAYPNATIPPSSADANWDQLFPYTEVGAGGINIGYDTVSDPLKVQFTVVKTRYIMLYLKNDGRHGYVNYIELRQVKAFYTGL
jgi:hypothetical protein